MQCVGEQLRVVGVIQRDAGLVARGLDAEDQHENGVRPYFLPDFRYSSIRSTHFRILDADSTRKGKRALRSGNAQVQAHRGEDRAAYRAARPRVLREADFGE